MTDKLVVFSTCESMEQATKVARHLVETRLAACVNIVPGARSIYRWQGQIEEASELMLVIKTRRALLPALELQLKSVHSYEVPEVVALSIADGSAQYLDWIDRETESGE